MTSIWPEIEHLLLNVEKPARYIGLERGAIQPPHDPRNVAWLLTYPDAYEVGFPNQDLFPCRMVSFYGDQREKPELNMI